ncbi:MAG: hypothetical protein OXF79_16095 [Chloroflexi bacterium]|nr:hypothetical protein [Chloroflexota bacterium]
MSGQEETRLWERLRQIRNRIQEIADLEARGAIFGSGAADGRLDPERERLIKKTEEILGKLEAKYRNALGTEGPGTAHPT